MKDLYRPPSRARNLLPAPVFGVLSGGIAAALVLALVFSGCASGGLKSGGVARFLRENFSPQSGGVSLANCRDGVWEGLGRGYRGNILVRLSVAGGLIRNIEIAEHGEDPAVGGEAMAELLEQVLVYGPAETDAVSGATESSRGFLSAVEDALRRGSGK
ncbi:MAG: FMN-binding protein [Treponema sp.]|jgi:uncharacterized protein with FMN-binding domain|nr:FMN-binding protein [Treponema sp.]